jgi:cell volume regulation protein A
MKYRSKVFTVRPGDGRIGVADRPTEVLGVEVLDTVLVRTDQSAALVVLADQRYAITGNVMAVGNARDVADYAGGRALRCPTRSDRRWFRECANALSAAHPLVGKRFVAGAPSLVDAGDVSRTPCP